MLCVPLSRRASRPSNLTILDPIVPARPARTSNTYPLPLPSLPTPHYPIPCSNQLQPIITLPDFRDVTTRLLDARSRSTVFIPLRSVTEGRQLDPTRTQEAMKSLRYHILPVQVLSSNVPVAPNKIVRPRLSTCPISLHLVLIGHHSRHSHSSPFLFLLPRSPPVQSPASLLTGATPFSLSRTSDGKLQITSHTGRSSLFLLTHCACIHHQSAATGVLASISHTVIPRSPSLHCPPLLSTPLNAGRIINVVQADILSSNGVIHLIDGMIDAPGVGSFHLADTIGLPAGKSFASLARS